MNPYVHMDIKLLHLCVGKFFFFKFVPIFLEERSNAPNPPLAFAPGGWDTIILQLYNFYGRETRTTQCVESASPL